MRSRITGPRLIFLCFFLSGATGLVYQVVWLRMLGLVFGHTVYAITTVLSAFMAGLALGSFVFGGITARLTNRLATYGWLEIAIGAYCLTIPALLDAAAWGYLAAHTSLGLSYNAFSLVQFGIIFVLLLIPTTLMGGTLPVLTQAVSAGELQFGRTVGLLYAVNTAGAVAGVTLAGYFLLPAVGNRTSLFSAAVGNLAIGIVALALSRSRERRGLENTESARRPVGRVPFASRVTVLALAVSGGVSMVYEIAWTRALALVIGSSTYAFTAMLIAVLAGIAGGSALYSWLWGRRRPSAQSFAAIQAGIGVVAALALVVFPRLPEVFLAALAWSTAPAVIQVIQLFVSACALLPATLLIGATFPCAVAVVARDPARIGEHVGRVYAANTLGAIVGAAVGGFLVIPELGVHGSLAVGSATNLVLAVALLVSAGRPQLRRWSAAAAAAFLAIGVLRLPAWDQRIMTSGPAVYGQRYRGKVDEWARTLGLQSILFYRDGISSTVSVHKVEDQIFLRVNGKTDASTGEDMPTQLLSGHVPLMVHPEPRNVLIIGLGSGVTAGAAARHPVQRIDVVEIEPAVFEAARFFANVNHDVLADRRLTSVVADGRNFLMTTSEQYDVIISEPSNPWIGGLASLFSREFFQQAEHRLRPGGLMLQWLQAYSLFPEDLRMVVATFRSVFSGSSIWITNRGDLLLLGGRGRVPIDPAMLERRYTDNPGTRADLQRIGIEHGAAILGYLALGEEDTAHLADGAGINTDDRLPLEFSAPRALYVDTTSRNRGLIAAAKRTSPVASVEPALDALGSAGLRHALGVMALRRDDQSDARRHFERALAVEPGHIPSSLELANMAYRNGEWAAALQIAREVLSRQGNNARANYVAGISAAKLFRLKDAQAYLERAIALDPTNIQYSNALMQVGAR